mmetsp:Transcript_11077/g.16847  ORF Transcript_11077/g.16847 Transcript_11077/m.16847 type:complete len:82 (-) Transcript_11077:1064-1309(-)
MKKGEETLPLWYRDSFRESEDQGKPQLPCKFDGVIRCDEDYLQGYRNKVEFTIGREYAGMEDQEEGQPIKFKKGPICIGFN